MLFPRIVCKISEVLLRRSLANSRDTSCHRSVTTPASWNSSSLDFTRLYFKPVWWGKWCAHHTRPPYLLRGQEFSLPTPSFLWFSKISVQNQLILGLLFPSCCFSWLFYEWLVWAAHTAQIMPATRGGIWNVALFYSYHNLCVNSYACVHMNIFSIHFMTL